MLNASADIASYVSPFLSDQYLNTAGLNRTWRDAYYRLPTTTRGVDKYTTVNQFMSHLELGYGRGSAPSDPSSYTPPSRIIHSRIPCKTAASLGRTDLLQAAYESGIARKDLTACTSAAANGHLHTIKYLHFIECPWDESTANAAAEGGHLELLQWIIDNGCPSNNLTQLNAASNGDLYMLMWLHSNGHPTSRSVLVEAASAGATHIIDWARSIGIEHTSTFTAAVKSGDMGVVEYLAKTRHPWYQMDLLDYIRRVDVDRVMVEWLTTHGYVE